MTELEEIKDMYLLGETITNIAIKCNTSRIRVRKILKSVGIYGSMPTLNCRRYKIDNESFNNDSSTSLYWQGFLMADGHVSKDFTLEVHLAPIDKAHLEKLKSFLKFTGNIKERSAGCKLRVTSRNLYNGLKRIGICDKSLERIPNDIQAQSKDFWRGVVDGDGWLSTTSAACPAVTLIGGEILIEKFIDFYKTNLNISHITKRKRKSVGLYEVTLTGKKALSLVDLLYSSPEVYLERKFERAQNLLALK